MRSARRHTPRLHRRRGAHPCARHRSQHRHLQRRQPLLLSPPPYREPDRIVSMPQIARDQADRVWPSCRRPIDFQDWRRETRRSRTSRSTPRLAHAHRPRRPGPAERCGCVSPARALPAARRGPMVGRIFVRRRSSPPPRRSCSSARGCGTRSSDATQDLRPADRARRRRPRGHRRHAGGRLCFPSTEIEYWVPYPLAPPERNPEERRQAIVPFLARLKPGARPIEQAVAGGKPRSSRDREADQAAGARGPRRRRARKRWRAGGCRRDPAEMRTGPSGAAGPELRTRGRPMRGEQRAAAWWRTGFRSRTGGDSRRASGPRTERAVRQDRSGGRVGPRRRRAGVTPAAPARDPSGAAKRPAAAGALGALAAVGLVLLIACANVANLQLSRASRGIARWRFAPRSAPVVAASSGRC